MTLERLTPMLWTPALRETIGFYQRVLGFYLDEYNEEWGWCHMHKDKVSMMFARPNEHVPASSTPAFSGSFYFYIDDVDALWDELSTKATVSYPIANFPHHMREFAIFDNNGYLLQFGREMRADETVTAFE